MRNSVELLNKEYEKDRSSMLEQYRIISESADKITDKRQNTNNFYLAVNTFLVGITGYLTFLQSKLIPFIISLTGILISAVWYANINSFKKLNSAKFKVIHAIEHYLPLRIYQKEDEYLSGYYKLTSCEKYVPFIFGTLYLVLIVIIIVNFVLGLYLG
jgi:hypothetical protein